MTLYFSLLHLVSCRLFSCLLAYNKPHLCQQADDCGTKLTSSSTTELPRPQRATHLTWLHMREGTSQHKTQLCYCNECCDFTVSLDSKKLLPKHLSDEETQNFWLHCHWRAISLTHLQQLWQTFLKSYLIRPKYWKSTEQNWASGCSWTLCSSPLLEKSSHTIILEEKTNKYKRNNSTRPPTDS